MLPKLTDEERRAACVKASEIRHRRAELREHLKMGSLAVEDLFKLSDSGDQAAAGMRAWSLITAMPGFGEKKSKKLMDSCHISKTRRVRGLGINQRTQLIEAFKEPARG